MNFQQKKWIKVIPVFLLGSNPSFIREDGLGFRDVKDEAEQNARTDEVLHGLGVEIEPKVLVREEDDFHGIDTNADVLIIFAHCLHRFPHLIKLAQTGIPMIISSEEGAAGEILDTYEYLAEFDNVKVAFSLDEIRRRLRILNAVRQIGGTKVCVFDSGERPPDGVPWYNNPLLKGMFNTEYVDLADFEKRYKSVDKKEAESLAKKWMTESEVKEPSLEDVARSARLYIAMKGIIEDIRADAAYVLWCAQFDKMLGTKMCLAVTKLNDAGHLTGCWRGENLLPMLILHYLSQKPIFFGEVHTYRDGILSVRHCAVPSIITSSPLVLRNWRDRKGTVTGYCQMPKGGVTVLNSGIGDRIVVVQGEVVKCEDLGGDNCRTTVWVKLEDQALVHKLTGRELAMVYGDCVEEAKEVGTML
jgi:L-fucose isomerase-like protein